MNAKIPNQHSTRVDDLGRLSVCLSDYSAMGIAKNYKPYDYRPVANP